MTGVDRAACLNDGGQWYSSGGKKPVGMRGEVGGLERGGVAKRLLSLLKGWSGTRRAVRGEDPAAGVRISMLLLFQIRSGTKGRGGDGRVAGSRCRTARWCSVVWEEAGGNTRMAAAGGCGRRWWRGSVWS
jgi:hypothetical protein